MKGISCEQIGSDFGWIIPDLPDGGIIGGHTRCTGGLIDPGSG